MGDGPPTDGARDLLKRMTDAIAERKTVLGAVEKQELAALTKLAATISK